MKKKTAAPIELETMAPKTREKRIEDLENERFSLTKKIEALMNEYVKVSGNRKLKRAEKPGSSPNDYPQEKNR